MRTILRIVKNWLPLAIATAGLCALVYLTVQQILRQDANDPQIQMAEDAARNLNAGANVESVVPAAKVEIADSLAPFLIVFDDSGNVVASSATLHGSTPAYPAGVLDYTRQKGEDRVTWQPEAGVRMATVVVRSDNGFVLAGRSLREVETRETAIEQLSFLALLAIWAATLAVIAVAESLGPKDRI
ncbi:MAG TPA: hypothetical protein VMC09_07680 [Anaerolineales bacterium]|nr:hypothetical protein [Anaerolineales bacterium]